MRPALGTFFEIALEPADDADPADAFGRAFETVTRLEKVFNRFDPQSELARVNLTTVGEWTEISAPLAEVFHIGEEIERESARAFRLMPENEVGLGYALEETRVARSRPSDFDFGGIAKGYIVDRVFEELRATLPAARIIVNAGGDLRTSHAGPFAVRVPSETEGERLYQVELAAGALATSVHVEKDGRGSAAARYRQSLSSEARTVSVAAETCMVADALTKAVLFGDSLALARARGIFRFSAAGVPL